MPDKWRPIETGPKDGKFYIVGYFGKSEIDLAKWSDTNDGWACKYTGRLIRPDVWQLPPPEAPK